MYKDDDSCSTGCSGIMWWATLVMAVLAVPSFGAVVALMAPLQGLGQIVVFILACWLCTYLGMKLMQNPKMHEKIDFSGKDKK
jgi:hypothetical protein